jgi:hypothetical protein
MLMAAGVVAGAVLGVPVALSGVTAPIATQALTHFVDDAAAQTNNCTNTVILGCIDVGNTGSGTGGSGARGTGGEGGLGHGGRGGSSDADSGDGGDSGNGGAGGLSTLHDVGNAHANASSSVIVGDVETGDVDGHAIQVDAEGATKPVVTLVAGSFADTGVDIFAPGGNAQAGTTGGNANAADASGGDTGDGGNGGDATSRGGHGGRGVGAPGGQGTATGNGGNGGDSCSVLLLGCIGIDVDVDA